MKEKSTHKKRTKYKNTKKYTHKNGLNLNYME